MVFSALVVPNLPGRMGRNGKEDSAYIQPIIVGLVTPKPVETELDNCLVLSRPEYKGTGKKQEWACAIHAQPSIFQPDTNAVFLASACNELVISARQKSLKPGDRVVLTGIANTQTIVCPNGEIQTINRIT